MVIVDDGGDGRWRPVVPNGEVLDIETARFVKVANLGTNDAASLPSKELEAETHHLALAYEEEAG